MEVPIIPAPRDSQPAPSAREFSGLIRFGKAGVRRFASARLRTAATSSRRSGHDYAMACGGLSSGAVEMPFIAGSSANDGMTCCEAVRGGTTMIGATRCATQLGPTVPDTAAFFAISAAALSSLRAIAAIAPSRLTSARAWSVALRWTHIAAPAENPCPRNSAQMTKKVINRDMS